MQFKGTLKEKFKANRVPGIQAYNARSSFVKHPASSDARASHPINLAIEQEQEQEQEQKQEQEQEQKHLGPPFKEKEE